MELHIPLLWKSPGVGLVLPSVGFIPSFSAGLEPGDLLLLGKHSH